MKTSHDFSKMKSRCNPYASHLRTPVALRLSQDVIDYFKAMSAETGVPYQGLIELYLRDCVLKNRRLENVLPPEGRRQRVAFGIAFQSRPESLMSARVEEIAAQALALPAEDRARLAEQLLASFEPRTDAQAKWIELALRRREEARSGQVTMLPGAEALSAIRSRIA